MERPGRNKARAFFFWIPHLQEFIALAKLTVGRGDKFKRPESALFLRIPAQ